MQALRQGKPPISLCVMRASQEWPSGVTGKMLDLSGSSEAPLFMLCSEKGVHLTEITGAHSAEGHGKSREHCCGVCSFMAPEAQGPLVLSHVEVQA